MTASDIDIAELESQLDDHRQRLADHEAVLAKARDRHDAQSKWSISRVIGAGGVLAALGLGSVGTASADPQGQLGTENRPATTVYTAALDGSVTDGQRITSLVGDGLTVENGTLTLASGN